MKLGIKKRNIVMIICAIAFCTVIFLVYQSLLQPVELKSIKAYAEQMIEICSSSEYKPTCYEKEVPKLVSDLPTEKIFDVVREIRTQDPEYLYCHVLAHELGRYEVSLDPDRWLDVIAKGPTDGLCSNGFAHGAIVTRFNDEDLSKEEFDAALTDLSVACEPREGFDPTDLTKAICYHGIGHVLIHMTLAKVSESLQACEVIGKKDDGRDYRQLCTEGVYMQLFQPLEPEDYALVDMLDVKPSRENLKEFCSSNAENDPQYGACWREAWPFFGNDVYTSEGITSYCSSLTASQDRDLCYVSAFTINGRHNLESPEKMAATCNGLAEVHKGNCFARGANAFPEEDQNLVQKGIEMCGLANTKAAQDECYGFLANVASFNFHRGSEAYEELCSSLPKEFEEDCRGE
jgi:hypothetical protein